MTTHAQLAQRLLSVATRAFATLPPDRRVHTYPTLDAFIERPAGDTFLAALRVLSEEQRSYRLERLHAAGSERAFERGLQAISAHPSVEAQVGEALGQMPLDPMAGKRLEALALLLEAHHELAARAEHAVQTLKKQLAQSKPSKRPPPGPGRRRVVNRIGA